MYCGQNLEQKGRIIYHQGPRQLARLKMTLNNMKNEDNSLNDILCGKKFDDVIAAVHQLTGLHENEEDVNRFEKPGLALKLCHNLGKAAEIKIGINLRKDDSMELKEAEDFLKLMKAEWKNFITPAALATLKTNRFNKGELLSLTEDFVKL